MVFWRFNYTASFHSQKEKAEVSHIFSIILGRKKEILFTKHCIHKGVFWQGFKSWTNIYLSIVYAIKNGNEFSKKGEKKGVLFDKVDFFSIRLFLEWKLVYFDLKKSVWLKLLMAWLSQEDPSRPQAGSVIKHNDWVVFHVFLSSSSKPGFYSSVIDWLIVWLMLW